MANKAKHAFGSSQNIEAALKAGTINERDILFLDEETDHPKVGWISKNGEVVIVEGEEHVIAVESNSLPESGEKGKIYLFNNEGYFWNGTGFSSLSKSVDLSALEAEIATKVDAKEVDSKIETASASTIVAAKAYTDGKIEAAVNEHLVKKYEITSTPEGTLINYGEDEIRVMCPADTKWIKQNVGDTGNADMYYMGFKAYAPDGAVGFKEGDRGVIKDEYFDFSGDFAGTDEFGRNYSIVWLALASCNNDTWTYFGEGSSTSKYIGWDYIVEWYNADGIVIASDAIRINLANENCYIAEPYYISNVKSYMNEQIEEAVTNAIEEVVNDAIEIVEF